MSLKYLKRFLHFFDGVNDTLLGSWRHGVASIVDIAHGLGKDLGMDGSNISSRILVQKSISSNSH